MQFLKDANYQGAYLWTTNEQIQAAALYIRYGFRLAEEKDSACFRQTFKGAALCVFQVMIKKIPFRVNSLKDFFNNQNGTDSKRIGDHVSPGEIVTQQYIRN